MTYITWKDEVESYLGALSADEKQAIFSYFSEMYADKRDAGKSEAQIIAEFGAPYDVAKRILDGTKDAAPQSADEARGTVTGGNYNYNYYNYNYGAPPPQPTTPPRESYGAPEKCETDKCTPPPAQTAAAKPAGSGGHPVLKVFLTIGLVVLAVALIGMCVCGIVQGAITVARALGALVSGKESGIATAYIGFGLINAGGALILLAPVDALLHFLRKKLKAFK